MTNKKNKLCVLCDRDRLEKENKRLMSDNMFFCSSIEMKDKEIAKLIKEDEQLKYDLGVANGEISIDRNIIFNLKKDADFLKSQIKKLVEAGNGMISDACLYFGPIACGIKDDCSACSVNKWREAREGVEVSE